MSLTEKKFKIAVDFIQNLPSDGPYSPSINEQLKFYSLYKQATLGPNKQKKPSFYEVVKKKKWDAYKKLGKMSKEKAMEQYVSAFVRVARKIKDKKATTALQLIKEAEQQQQQQKQQKITAAAASGSEENNDSNNNNNNNTIIINNNCNNSNNNNNNNEDDTVELYATNLSQPSRAVLLFLKVNDIKYNFINVNLPKKEHLQPSFAKINPLKKIPAIKHDGNCFYESHSIMRYLAQSFAVSDNWYPHDLLQRTKVDQYLDWHHMGMRKGSMTLVWSLLLAPSRNIPVRPGAVESAKKEVTKALDTFSSVFISSTPFIAGSDISIADLSAYCEIKQLVLVAWDFKTHPLVEQWLARVENELHPHVDDVNSILFKFATKSKL